MGTQVPSLCARSDREGHGSPRVCVSRARPVRAFSGLAGHTQSASGRSAGRPQLLLRPAPAAAAYKRVNYCNEITIKAPLLKQKGGLGGLGQNPS